MTFESKMSKMKYSYRNIIRDEFSKRRTRSMIWSRMSSLLKNSMMWMHQQFFWKLILTATSAKITRSIMMSSVLLLNSSMIRRRFLFVWNVVRTTIFMSSSLRIAYKKIVMTKSWQNIKVFSLSRMICARVNICESFHLSIEYRSLSQENMTSIKKSFAREMSHLISKIFEQSSYFRDVVHQLLQHWCEILR